MTKVYHIYYGDVKCIKKFKTEAEAKDFIEKDYNEQIKMFGKIIHEYFI